MLEIVALVMGTPVLLLALLLVLGRLEAELVTPGERAAELVGLIDSAREPEDVEHAAAQLLADVAPAHGGGARAA